MRGHRSDVKAACSAKAVGVQSLSEVLNNTFDRRDLVVTGDARTREMARLWLDSLERNWADMPDAPDEVSRREIVSALRAGLENSGRPASADEGTLYLERLAHHFSGEDVRFEDASQLRAFCERLRRSVNLLVAEFQELLAGRKKVQNDWALFSSSLSGDDDRLMTRDVRLGDLHGDLGRILFDWRQSDVDPNEALGLKQALDELKHHQLATMAGYERSVTEGARSLLDSLDPSSVEREFLGVSEDQTGKAHIGLKRFIPFRGYFLWQAYRKRYSQISNEDARWYQRQFLPAFRQGYRDYMVSRASVAGRHNQNA
jgi:hypothetical protein